LSGLEQRVGPRVGDERRLGTRGEGTVEDRQRPIGITELAHVKAEAGE
jgi:hypothetical protein